MLRLQERQYRVRTVDPLIDMEHQSSALCNPCVVNTVLTEYVKSDRRLHVIPLHYGNRYLIDERGELWDAEEQRYKSNRIGSKGYIYNHLLSDNNISISYPRHRLVALTFHDNPHNKEFVNHKDAVRHNNHKDNVEWNTHQENMIHSGANKKQGNSAYATSDFRRLGKLTPLQVVEARRLLREGLTMKDIATVYGMSESHFVSAFNSKYAKSY